MPVEMWWFIGAAGALLAAAALLLRPGPPSPHDTVDPQIVALLRGGHRAAVTVALVALQQRGVVTNGRKGTVRTDGWATAIRDPLQLAVHVSLRRPLGLRPLVAVPRVRRALDALRVRSAEAGLLRPAGRWRAARLLLCAVPVTIVAGLLATPITAPNTLAQLALCSVPVAAAAALWCVPRQTPAGRRLLVSLRGTHPLEARRTAGPRVLLSVALHGDAALLLHLPHFARGGGLLTGGGRDTGFTENTASSGSAGAACGL
ncbi:TIGR04222 domain-containing membrane protein [Streptomyces sp. NPDC006283]|uniref:TIGR04222 domain-containing membrane protein n=1 Tax=Streptomyces sp. NPDC006283 TaxID=3156741 RepID=UPI0033AE43FB